MVPLFKDYEWDHKVGMVYVSTMKPGSRKGPIVHSERSSIMTAIDGWVRMEALVDGKLQTYLLHKWAVKGSWLHGPGRPPSSTAVLVPAGIPVRYSVPHSNKWAILISMPDIAWTPNNDDSTRYNGWDDYHKKVTT